MERRYFYPIQSGHGCIGCSAPDFGMLRMVSILEDLNILVVKQSLM